MARPELQLFDTHIQVGCGCSPENDDRKLPDCWPLSSARLLSTASNLGLGIRNQKNPLKLSGKKPFSHWITIRDIYMFRGAAGLREVRRKRYTLTSS